MSEPRSPDTSKQQTYSKRRLVGLDAHSAAQRRATVGRLTAAIESLKTKKQPISIKTIREECGLEYNSIKRNSEAYLLYRQHSTFLKSKRQHTKSPQPTAPTLRDPLLAYKKSQLVTRLRGEMELRQELEARHLSELDEEKQRRRELEATHATLLEEYVQKDILIAELQARIAEYEEYLERPRLQFQRREEKKQ